MRADVYQTVETTEIGASMEATGGGDVAHVSDGDYTSAEGERRSPGHRQAMASWPRVSVIIPTLNEAQNLPHVLGRLPRRLHEVVVYVLAVAAHPYKPTHGRG